MHAIRIVLSHKLVVYSMFSEFSILPDRTCKIMQTFLGFLIQVEAISRSYSPVFAQKDADAALRMFRCQSCGGNRGMSSGGTLDHVGFWKVPSIPEYLYGPVWRYMSSGFA